jgi:hypothetical protein
MKFIEKYFIVLMLSLVIISGCSDNPVKTNTVKTETLLYEKPGLVDSLVGTCSAYLVRTLILDSLDTRNYNELKVKLNAYTDGDLSNVSVYYLNADTNNIVFVINGLNQINNTDSYTFSSPKIKDIFFLRLRLFASVCTGQNYHLKIRDLKIYGVN